MRYWYVTPFLAGLGCLLSNCSSEEQLASPAPISSSLTPAPATPAPLTVPVPRSLDDALKAGRGDGSQLREQTLAPLGPHAPSSSSPSGDSGKPALEIYRAGLEKLLDTQVHFRATLREEGMTDEQIDAYLGCVVDQTHSTMSPGFLNTVAPGKSTNAQISHEDQETLDKAIEFCSTQW